MSTTRRELILDIYLFDQQGNISFASRDDKDIYILNADTPIILNLPLGKHPIKYIQDYLATKGLNLIKVDLLPAFFQNIFDSEPEVEYLVTSYKVVVDKFPENISGDKENPNIKTSSFEEFKNNPQLTSEFKTGGFEELLKGKGKYYSGTYRDSDGSNAVISFTNY